MWQFDKVPDELKQRNQWVLWRSEKYSDASKPTKVPYLTSGRRASVTDSTTWCSFEEIQLAYISNSENYSGVGYVFSADDPYTGIDLDACIVAAGKPSSEAQQIIRELDSYTEWSQSSSGVHVILKAIKPGTRSRIGNFEIYDHGRFFVVTGNHLDGTPLVIMSRQREVQALYERKLGSVDKAAVCYHLRTQCLHFPISSRIGVSNMLKILQKGYRFL